MRQIPSPPSNCPQPQGSLRQGRVEPWARLRGGAIKPLFSAEAIAARVDELCRDIAAAGLDDLIIVAVLKGSFIFAADLIRALHREGLRPEIDFIFLASYDGEPISGGEVRVLRDVESDLAGRNVVIVDDILDSGRTLAFAKALLEEARAPGGCSLASWSTSRCPALPAIEPDFRGFRCPAVFVVGYGMDLRDRYRELPFIGELKLCRLIGKA